MAMGDSALVHAFAGSAAAALSLLLFYPLDVLRTHAQLHPDEHTDGIVRAAWRHAERHGGWGSLWQAVGPSVQTQWVSFFVYFFVYQYLKSIVVGDDDEDSGEVTGEKQHHDGGTSHHSTTTSAIGPVANLAVAAVAGAINVMATAPLWLAATRLKTRRLDSGGDDDDDHGDDDDDAVDGGSNDGESDGGRRDVRVGKDASGDRQRGGAGPRQTRAVKGGRDRHAAGDSDRRRGGRPSGRGGTGPNHAGDARPAEAGASRHGAPSQQMGLLGMMLAVAREEGLLALWAGVTSSLLLVTNPMIQFAVYEQSKRIAAAALVVEDTGDLYSATFFFLGGWAKFVATLMTYPLQVVQCRQRAVATAGEVSR